MLIFIQLYSMTDKNKKEYQEIVLDLLKGTIDQSELKNLYFKDSEHNDELKNKETIEKTKTIVLTIYVSCFIITL